jgi:hypothetical protein
VFVARNKFVNIVQVNLNLRSDELLIIPLLFLAPWSRVCLNKLTGFQLAMEVSAFYGARSFITAFITARHVSIS